MNEDEELLAAFLAHPDGPAAQASYAIWLERRGDPRGEYFCLSTGMDEPIDPEGGDAARRRLRELRELIDPGWADRIDRCRVLTGGLYQSEERNSSWSYLRFYSDGAVLEVGSTGLPSEVWRWFLKGGGNGPHPHEGKWSIRGDRLNFFIPGSGVLMNPRVMHPRFSGDMDGWEQLCEDHNAECMRTRVEYEGSIGRRTVCLRWHSHLNGNSGVRAYRFVPLP